MGGSVGRYLVEELVKTGKHKVTAITRSDSTSKPPAGVEVKKVNYDDQDSLYVYNIPTRKFFPYLKFLFNFWY